MKRARYIFLSGILILSFAISWEYVFDRQNVDTWVKHLEYRLHDKEREADEKLEVLQDTLHVDSYNPGEDLIFVGFRNGDLFYWTNKSVGIRGIYNKLTKEGDFVEINNSSYEIRRTKVGEVEYFALIHIKDTYPYNNKYIRDKFAGFLGISIENANNIKVSHTPAENSRPVISRDGEELFYIVHGEDYKDHSVNYFLLFLYLLGFLSFFYTFHILMRNAATIRRQVFYIIGFILFLVLLRFVMTTNNFPDSLYRLYLFDLNNVTMMSIGDILLSSFSLVQLLYISLSDLKINYQNRLLNRYSYVFVAGFVVLAFVYANFFNFAIRLVIENTNIHLNIARVVHIGPASIIAFVAVIMGGLGLIVVMNGSANDFKNFISFRRVMKTISITMAFCTLLSLCCRFPLGFWGCIYIWGLYLLIIINRYLVNRDVQQSIYLLTLLSLSIYIVIISKKFEEYKEQTQRLEYATGLIEERDYNFEATLAKISNRIEYDPNIRGFVEEYQERRLREYIEQEVLFLPGYNYISDITLCREMDSLFIEPEKVLWRCNDYFDQLIRDYGQQIKGTNFYSITDFDGFISYSGKFVYNGCTLYIRFDSNIDSEGSGYPQILSRKSGDGRNNVYFYSYAKYKDGKLVLSSGDFNYYKFLTRFGKQDETIKVMEQDRYSHMLIPVGKDGILVISLHESFFSLYFINVFYVFLGCLLISSYGLFFNLNYNLNFRRKSLKSRIKNRIVSLIFVLFVILTTLSIYLNSKSSEERHNSKAVQLLKYINKEMEQLDCVDARKCPHIIEALKQMSEMLTVDINLYGTDGVMVATSRPEIFDNGFDGYLMDQKGLKKILNGAMSYIQEEQIGEITYRSAYMPLLLKDGEMYILNVPYFAQNDELNTDIIIAVVIAINIAIVVMVLAFILSGLVAERVIKPLQLVNDKLKQMRVGGKNEKINYNDTDEVGNLVREYNNMVEKLENSVEKLAKSERESAWREMARQIAHEIKNPLTPMKLNIQFMQRSLQLENPEEFKKRFKGVSSMLIEQIDNMASIASAFSDFAKMPVANREVFNISEMVANCVALFANNVDKVESAIESELFVFADKEQINRVVINVLKNAEQCIPEGVEGIIRVVVKREGQKVVIRIKDNGPGIPEELRKNIFEPNFTTKSGGMGLGLAISKRVMESVGGTIDFVSNPDVGTEFFITLDGVLSENYI